MSSSKGKQLLEKGFRLTEEGLNLTGGNYDKALDIDLKEISQPFFPSEIEKRSRKIDSLENKDRIILQVKSIKNVSTPKIEESRSGIPRLLKITFTDGHTTMSAVEVTPLDNISTETPPGTKVRLMDVNLDIVSGFILLRTGSIKVLGGRVERLIESWEISRKFASFKRDSSSSSGPPPWVSFGKKLVIHPTLNEKDNKPVDGHQNGKEENKSDEPSEFDSQRQDAIKEASKSGYQKVFGGGKQEIKDGKKGMTRREEIFQKRKNKRGNKENEADALAAKPPPSSRVCLFDFMEKKIPSKEEDAAVLHHEIPSSLIPEFQPEFNHVKQSGVSFNRNANKREKPTGKSYNSNSGYGNTTTTTATSANVGNSHNQQSHVHTNNYTNSNSASDSKNRNNNRRNDYSEKKDRRDKPHQQHIPQQQHKQHQQQREPPPPQQHQQKPPEPNKKQRGPNPRSRRNENSDRDFGEWNNSTYTETQSQRKTYEESRSFSNSNYNNKGAPKKKHHQWKANDLALAKYWEDGLYYPVRIREVTSTTALVCFEGYENFEEVLFKDLKPKELSRKPQQQNQQYHPHH